MLKYFKLLDYVIVVILNQFIGNTAEYYAITYSLILPLILIQVYLLVFKDGTMIQIIMSTFSRIAIQVYYLEVYMNINEPLLLIMAIYSIQLTTNDSDSKTIIVFLLINFYYCLRIIDWNATEVPIIISSILLCCFVSLGSYLNYYQQQQTGAKQKKQEPYEIITVSQRNREDPTSYDQSGDVFMKIRQLEQNQNTSLQIQQTKPKPFIGQNLYTQQQQQANGVFQKSLKSSSFPAPTYNFELLDLVYDSIVLLEPETLSIWFCNKATYEIFKIGDNLELLSSLDRCEVIQKNQQTQNKMGKDSLPTFMSFRQKLNLRQENKNQFEIQSIKLIQENHNKDKIVQNYHLLLQRIINELRKIKSFQTLSSFKKEIFRFVNQYTVYYRNPNFEDQQRCLEMLIHSTIIDNRGVIILQARDVTHREYIKQIISDNKAKSNTISFVSHEYRSPLNQIIQYLNFAKENLEYSDAINYINIALNNSRYLLHLSNDLLDFAQIKAGKFNLVLTKFKLPTLLKECIEMFELTAKAKNIELKCQVDRDVPKQIENDPNRIKQVIVNLFGNAFKFTLQGSIELKVSLESHKHLKIQISDTGIGIKEEDQTHLFTAFGKLNNPESQKLNQQGVGLGLVISNSISACLNENGSGLQFESEYNQGTSFWFLVSTNIDQAELVSVCEDLDDDFKIRQKSVEQRLSVWRDVLKPQEKPKHDSHICAQAEILIADDNPFNIEMLKLLIQKRRPDVRIDSSYDGLDAYMKVKNKCQDCKQYQVIFMDIEMPHMNGYESCKLIKEVTPNVMIYGCSAYSSSSQEKMKCKEFGMDDYVEKPVGLEQIQTILNIIK